MSRGLVTPIIMCGGSGTRLWPASRTSRPKQFVPFVEQTSTFQKTAALVAGSDLFARPIVITNSEYRFLTAEQLLEAGVDAQIVLEPDRRDSGPAVAAGAELVARVDPDGIALVLPADHLIGDPESFIALCRAAVDAARAGRIVTFGIKAATPATAYGYIRPGAPLEGSAVHEVDAFVEKPDRVTAEHYVAEGYLWNSGCFMFSAGVMLGEIGRFEPAMREAVQAAVAGATQDLDFLRLDEAAFRRATRKSIDYAVMETTKLAAVIPAEYGWSDIGTWDALWEVLDHDEAGNATSGAVELFEAHNCLVQSDDSILTTVVGCDDLVVVTTPDAVLVTSRDRAGLVKGVVERLQVKNVAQSVEHRQVFRPWGSYEGVVQGPRHQVKRIVVKPGAKLSLQKHHHRSEHWVVVQGTAEVTIGDKVHTAYENESIYVPIGEVHRLANPGLISLELIEVQVGSYLGEDDIIRLEDVYRRDRQP